MKFRPLSLAALSILALLAGACRSSPPPAPTAPPEPGPSATPSVTPLPSPTPTFAPIDEVKTSSPEALAACNLEIQALAMLPDQLPDWNSLGIDTCYDLRFELNEGGTYTGSARITYTNLFSQALDDVVLRLYPNAPVIFGGQLTLLEARAGDLILAPEAILPDGSAVRLPLTRPLAPGETLTLELAFSGILPLDSPGEDTYGVFNLNSGGPIAMLANSYPLVAVREGGHWRADPVLPEGDPVISKIALYLAEIRVPENWKVAATGITLDHTRDGNQEVFQLVGGPVREFVWVASPAFEERNELIRDTFLQHWALPETEPGWDEAIRVAEDSLQIFSDSFGVYPYAELDVVALPLKNASGVEYPGLILIRDRLYTTTETPRLLSTVVAHEVAHQWWYALVGNDALRSPWQDEGLATFSAQLYQSQFNPTMYEGTRAFYENRVEEIEAQSGKLPIAQPVSAFSGIPSAYAVIVYQKSALFFEALRAQIGKEAFIRALQEYFSANRYQIAAPGELLQSFESACGCDLDSVYAEWGAQ